MDKYPKGAWVDTGMVPVLIRGHALGPQGFFFEKNLKQIHCKYGKQPSADYVPFDTIPGLQFKRLRYKYKNKI